MSPLAEEIARLTDGLPTDKAKALAEYAHYLADKADSEEWDRKFADPKYRRKFEALLKEVESEIAAGNSRPLDVNHFDWHSG